VRFPVPHCGRRILPAGHAAVLVVLCLVGIAAAQQAKAPARDYALIYGTVWSANDTPAAGVPVTIRRADSKKPSWDLVSDRRGEFAQRVPPGKQDYIVQANIKVPKGQPKPEVTVHIEDNERQDIGLHLTAAGTNLK
jgi:hypothetical protein